MNYEWGSLTFLPFRAVLLPDVACSHHFLIPRPFKNLLSSIGLGVINIPAVALGMFSGGVVMKKYKLGIMGAAKFAFGTSLLGYFLSLFFLAMGCENARVAGITVSYSGYVMPGNAHVAFLCLYSVVLRWYPFFNMQSGRIVVSGAVSLLGL